LKEINIEGILNRLKEEIVENVKTYPLYIAFSGGMDSTVLACVAKEALGKENVKLIHVVYGPYTYFKTLENVLRITVKLGIDLRLIDHQKEMEAILKYGPSCNLCTKKVKLGGVKECVRDENCLVATGSNQSDSWGSYGQKIMNGTYSPLLDLDKDELRELLFHYGFKIEDVRAGESVLREGCKLKHLMKMLAVPEYHGRACVMANEILLDILSQAGVKSEMANVKIIGPLKTNIALINVKPFIDKKLENIIIERIKKEKTIADAFFVNRPIRLFIKANPSIYRIADSKKWLEKGKFAAEFAIPPEVVWSESPNNKMRTYHAISFEYVEK